jgi:hypothetical protein
MEVVARRRPDGLALAAALLAAVMGVAYAWLMNVQGDAPRAWYLALLLAGALLAGYGAVLDTPGRRVALALSAVVLLTAGALALASIGLPVLAAGGLAVLAGLR